LSERWTRPTRVTWWAVIVSVAMTSGTAAYLASTYSLLPIGLPVRYVRGVPLIYQLKTPLMVMLPAIVQLGLLIVFGSLMSLLLWRARPSLDTGLEDTSGDATRMCLAAEGIALLAAVWISVQAFGAVRLIVLWRGGAGGYGELYFFAIVTAIVASIVITANTMKRVGRDRPNVLSVDPTVWRLRQLYFNPADPALFVRTRTGGGWTLNFGRPVAIVLLAATLVVGIGGPYMVARYVLRGFGN
jgi:uncharacterized membrane protein